MYARMDFDPVEVVESEPFGVDFLYDLSRLQPGEQLIGAPFGAAPTVTLAVLSGTDATPQAHCIGDPYVAVNPFNKTGLVTMVVQVLSGLLPGVQYSMEAVASTNFGNRLSLWSKIPPEDPPDIWSPRA